MYRVRILYFIGDLQQEYIPTTAFTWDQEAEDSFPIVLPHKPVWDKRGYDITHIETQEDVRHEGTIDAGWSIHCDSLESPPPLSLEEQTRLNVTSIHADDEEGIQRRFGQLRDLYGFLSMCTKNVEEEIEHANE